MRNPAGQSAIPAKKARPACLSSATAMAATGLFRKAMWKPVRARKRPPCARCAKKRARRYACPGYREVTTYSPAKGVTKDVVFFVAEITGGTLRAQPEEVRAVCLLPLEEAQRRLTYAADKELLEKAKNMILDEKNG